MARAYVSYCGDTFAKFIGMTWQLALVQYSTNQRHFIYNHAAQATTALILLYVRAGLQQRGRGRHLAQHRLDLNYMSYDL